MRNRWWWLQLQVWQWLNAWRVRPVRRTLSPLLWFVPVIVLTAGLSLAGGPHARMLLEWLLSVDIPLALLLSIQVGAAIVAVAARVDTESWISPAARRVALGRALMFARLLHAARWPTGLALAGLLLALGSTGSRQGLIELLLIALFGFAVGACLAWLLVGTPRALQDSAPVMPSRASGLAVLSWVPLREAGRYLDLRRIALLTVPVLLAAPMGSVVQQVLRALVVWVPLLYLSTWLREAARTTTVIGKWMPLSRLQPLRLYWWVWRHVGLAMLLCGAALWVWWQVTSPAVARGYP